MEKTIDRSAYTFSNAPSQSGPAHMLPQGGRPKANPHWMRENRPTIQLPETELPPTQGEAPAQCMNNQDLIEHAFSTPTSATPLNGGYSSTSDTPLLGFAGLSFFTEKESEEQMADFQKIFDKLSMFRGSEQTSQTPPPNSSAQQRLNKKVSFDVQPIPTPLSAKPYNASRNASWDFSSRASVWENSVDNEDEIIAQVRTPGEPDVKGPESPSLHGYTTGASHNAGAMTFPTADPSRLQSPHAVTAMPFVDLQSPTHLPPRHSPTHPDSPATGRKPSFPPRSDQYRHGEYRDQRMRPSQKQSLPLTCFACRGVGHKATQCPNHPRPVVATSSTDVIVTCAIHGKPRTSKNMFFNNELGVWQCFAETQCKSMIN